MLKNSKKESKKGDKLKLDSGPYEIHEVVDKGVCKIKNTKSEKILATAVNQARLKIYNLPSEPQVSTR